MHLALVYILQIQFHDLMLAQQAICPLSYVPNYWKTILYLGHFFFFYKDRREKQANE